MKKRVLAVALALAMVLSLAPIAGAASYPDVAGRWSESYILDMTARGLYEGFDDGNFYPTRELTLGEAVAVSVRMCDFEAEQVAAAVAEYGEAVVETLNGAQFWFEEEYTLAVAAGILTLDELSELVAANALGEPLSREEFSVYLVRALQVEVGTPTISFDFGDADDIGEDYRLSVYILTSLGIVEGDEYKNFNPRNTIRREDSATMFSRALEYIEENGAIIELEQYADYDMTVGTITSYDGETLVLETLLEGEMSFAIPDTAKFYRGNVVATSLAATSGAYARVCYTSAGVFAVRISERSALKYAGAIKSFEDGILRLNTGTRTVEFEPDARTRVLAGGEAGSMAEVYDSEAGYESATVYVDPRGNVAAIEFIGGSRLAEAFLVEVGGDGSLKLEALNGEARVVTLADDAALELAEDAELADYVGGRVVVRETEDGVVVALTPIEGTYVSGAFVRTTTRSTGSTITISDLDGTNELGRRFADEYEVFVEGEAAEIDELAAGMFVRMKIDENDKVLSVEAFDTTRIVEATLESISYGKTITLTLVDAEETVYELSFASDDMPTIKRGLRVITADKLLEGDLLTVEWEYWEVVLIEAKQLETNVVGTVSAVTIDASGTTITITDADGVATTYPLSDTVEISKDGVSGGATLAGIQGMQAECVVAGSMVISIDVTSAATLSGELRGTILFVNENERTILVEKEDGSEATVAIEFATRIMRADGTERYFSNLEAEQSVTIHYEIDANGAYSATIVIIK